jgi:hypothetical protein
MHPKSGAEGLRGMGGAREAKVISQNLAVVGMGAILDYCARAGRRALAAQIGDPLVGDYNLDGMLAVVQMADQWNDGADLAALGG